MCLSNPIEANLRALRREIEKAREATQGIIGVNIMVALTTFAEMVRTSIEAKADVIFSGAGLPMDLPKIFNETCERKKEEFKTKLVPIISSGRAATLIARKWMSSTGYMPDAFVVEGPKAGGHLGFSPEHIVDPNYALELLVPQVVEAVKPLEDKAGRAIPVIAAGGVYTGEDIKKYMDSRRVRRPDGHPFRRHLRVRRRRPLQAGLHRRQAGRRDHHQEPGGDARPRAREQLHRFHA